MIKNFNIVKKLMHNLVTVAHSIKDISINVVLHSSLPINSLAGCPAC